MFVILEQIVYALWIQTTPFEVIFSVLVALLIPGCGYIGAKSKERGLSKQLAWLPALSHLMDSHSAAPFCTVYTISPKLNNPPPRTTINFSNPTTLTTLCARCCFCGCSLFNAILLLLSLASFIGSTIATELGDAPSSTTAQNSDTTQMIVFVLLAVAAAILYVRSQTLPPVCVPAACLASTHAPPPAVPAT